MSKKQDKSPSLPDPYDAASLILNTRPVCENCGVQPANASEGQARMAVVPWKTGMRRVFANLDGIAGTFIMLCEDCIVKEEFHWPPADKWRIGTYRMTSEDPEQWFTVDSNGIWKGNWNERWWAEEELRNEQNE